MKKSTTLALAFATLAATAGGVYAADRAGTRAERMQQRFEKADADSSGDVTFEEFVAAMGGRIAGADADKDGKITVAEIAAEIDRTRVQRMAERLVKRFDTNGDGVLTVDEVQSGQKKMFDRLDRNSDGKLVAEELSGGKGKKM